jgi:outer membrane protein assembly factor BamB
MNKFSSSPLKRCLKVSLFLGAASVLLGNTQASDWSHYRGPQGSGVSGEAFKPSPGREWSVLWRARVGVGTASSVVANGFLYTMGHVDGADWVHCLDAATGKVLWTFKQPVSLDPNLFEGGARSTPTLDGQRLFALSHEGQVVCLESSTGAVLWRKHLVKDFGGRKPDWGYSGAPLVDGNRVIFDAGGVGASTIALDCATGALVWKDGSEPAGYASPLLMQLAALRALVVFKGDVLVGLDPENGRSLWRHPWPTSYKVNAATPLQVASNRILISSGYNAGAAMVEIDGGRVREVWRNKNLRAHINSPVYMDGLIYGVDGNTGGGNLVCLDAASGEKRWEEKSVKGGALVLAGGKLIVVSEKGDLVFAEAKGDGFRQISRQTVLSQRTWAQPVLANGRIYLRDNQGNLACLGN